MYFKNTYKMSVPSSMKLPPALRDVSNSVLGRRQTIYYPSTGALKYDSSQRLITFNISSEKALLDTDKLFLGLDWVIYKGRSDNVIVPNNSAESLIDRVVIRVGSKVIVDTSQGYGRMESMLHHFADKSFADSSGQIMGISTFDISKPYVNAEFTRATGAQTTVGNCTYLTRCNRFVPNSTALPLLASNGTTDESRATAPTLYNSCRFVIPIRGVGFLDQISSLIPLHLLDSTIALSIDIYLASDRQVMRAFAPGASGGANPPGAPTNTPSYLVENLELYADLVDVSDDYLNTINSYIANGGIYSIPSSEFNIFQFTIPSQSDVSVPMSAVYKDLEAIYISFFNNLDNFTHNGEDQLLNPNLGSIQLQIGSKYYPSDSPLDCRGRGVRAYLESTKAFNPNGIEAGFAVPADSFLTAHPTITATTIANFNTNYAFLDNSETSRFTTIAFSFESLLDEDESTITGLDTSQGSGIITIRLRGNAGNLTACTMVVVAKFKQQVMVGQNYTIDRML